MSLKKIGYLGVILFYLLGHFTYASVTIHMFLVDGRHQGTEVGTVKADDTIYGLLLTPRLHHLVPGFHGYHIHDYPLCAHQAAAAGGHFDPQKNEQHRGPYAGGGHLGDLPVLIVNADGQALLPVLAPRLKLATIAGHALVIHAQGDNYADIPAALGGGGARVACGVIPYY